MPRIDRQPTQAPERPLSPPARPASAPASEAPKLVGDTANFLPRAKASAAEAEPKPGFLAGLKARLGGWLSGLQDGLPKAVYALAGLWTGGSAAKFETRKIEDDGADVNDDSPARRREAAAETEAHAGAERAALAKLPGEARRQFEAVAAKAGAADPIARRELQQLLLTGRAEAVLPGLARLAEQPLAPGVDRGALLTDVIGEIESPDRVNQHQKGTCGATTAQIYLLRKDPAEYVRVVAGLAEPAGKVRLKGGETISRPADWAADNDGGRSTPSRLFQPAAMALGNDKYVVLGYDNTKDKAELGPVPLFGGLTNGAEVRILEQLTGKDFESIGFARWNRSARWEDLKRRLDAGQGPIPVSLVWNPYGKPGGHFVQIDRVADGRVQFTNPWGQRESLSEAEFKAHITGAQAPAA